MNYKWRWLRRFFKNVKVFELVMIFIGITLSMQFDNLNEYRKDRKKEKEILSSIYVDLKVSKIDLHNVVKGLEKYFISPLHELDSVLMLDSTLTAEAYQPMYFPIGSSVLYDNAGAYQNFKSNGGFLVRNNALKIALFKYYEVDLKWVNDQQNRRSQFENGQVMPLYLSRTDFEGKISYENYVKIHRNNTEKRIIYAWKKSYDYLKELYQELDEPLSKLLSEMEAELDDLGIDPEEILSDNLSAEKIEMLRGLEK